MIIVLFIFGLFIWFVMELGTLSVFGSPVDDNDLLEVLEKNKNKETHLTPDDSGIFVGKIPCIFKSSSSILFPYHVHNVGTIPFWYKSVKIIKILFNENKVSQRKKLGLDD